MRRSEFMRRREFIALIAGAMASPRPGQAQRATRVPIIGYLGVAAAGSSPQISGSSYEAFRKTLQELGYIEGQNITIHDRIANGDIEQLPGLARELVELKVDVILAGATPGAHAASKATTTIPIVAPSMGDPVSDGLVASLARPGGNITGSTFLGPELVPKRFELLRQILPAASRVAVLRHPNAFGERTIRDMVTEADAAARAQRLILQYVDVRDGQDFERAFSAFEKADALFVFPSVMLFAERSRIVAQADKRRLPLFAQTREFAELGSLVSYGPNIPEQSRRAAIYVDKILKGARPADLPVEQPTKFELVINLKTAKALGIAVPPTLLTRADDVIE
jgi:ABC-type uncharacterized transport system substrate-binding protein